MDNSEYIYRYLETSLDYIHLIEYKLSKILEKLSKD